VTALAAGQLPAGDGRWWHRAACLGADPGVFFADPRTAPLRTAEAMAFCAACPVRPECLADALAAGDAHGIRGGMTAAERRPLRPAPAYCGAGRHPRAAAGGQCRACKREADLERRPPAGRGKGNSDIPRDRERDGRFAPAAARDRNELAA